MSQRSKLLKKSLKMARSFAGEIMGVLEELEKLPKKDIRWYLKKLEASEEDLREEFMPIQNALSNLDKRVYKHPKVEAPTPKDLVDDLPF